jgi:hypothetical protein
VELYMDVLLEPLDYSIITLRMELKFDPFADRAYLRIQDSLDRLQRYTDYPVYKKFILVLRCSPQHALYEETYVAHDPARGSVPATVQKLLNDRASLCTSRDYLWFVDHQIDQAQFAYDMGCDARTCFARLKEIRPRGAELIMPGDEEWECRYDFATKSIMTP